MKKEVFTQEFEKCFTVFQQVELLKKYLNELDIESNDIPMTTPTLYLNEVELSFYYSENDNLAGTATFYIYTKKPMTGGSLQSIFDDLVRDYDINYMNKYPFDKVNINDAAILNFKEPNKTIVTSRIYVNNGVYPGDTGNKNLQLYYSRCKVVNPNTMSGSYYDLAYYPNDQTYTLNCTFGTQDTIKCTVSQVLSKKIF